MAWAAVQANGMVLSVGFDGQTFSADGSVQIITVPDESVIAVMEGRLKLQHVVVLPEPEPAIANLLILDTTVYSNRYPAMMNERDVDALISLMSLLPTDAIAVEAGSRFGGSAKIMLDNAASIKRLYCMDPDWADPNSPWIHSDPSISQSFTDRWKLREHDTCFSYAASLLGSYPNVRLLALGSPYEIAWWQEPIDFLFEDATHSNPQMNDNLNFWLPRVKSGGIIAGHDYNTAWPDVIREADGLAARLGAELQVRSTIWWLIKP